MSVSVAYVRMLAAYNAEMNRRLYDAAARLDDAARRGAFWGSIHGMLAHPVWGDRQWMSRFDDWSRNTVAIRDSAADTRPFAALREEREAMDLQIGA